MNYKFSKAADAEVRKKMNPQYGAESAGGVVRELPFRIRRQAQIDRRVAGEELEAKKKKRAKIAAARAGY